MKRPLSPGQPSKEVDRKGKRPLSKNKNKTKNSDVISVLDKKSEWCHEKRTPLTELDILTSMMCRVHINFPVQVTKEKVMKGLLSSCKKEDEEEEEEAEAEAEAEK